MHRLDALGVSLVCFLVIAIGTDVRFADQDRPPRFRAGVKVIQIDATVLDKNDKPIRGLTAEDFSILENGQPQPLVGFTEVVLPDTVEPSTPWLRDVVPDVIDNQTPEGRLLVLVMDDAMLPPDPAMLRVSKEIARGAVERMGSADRMAVVFTRDNRNAQDFTADRARLLKAVDRISIGFSFTDGPLHHYFESSVATLRLVAQALQKVPHRRKAIIYVSIGVPSSSDRIGMMSRATGLGVTDGLLDRIRDVLGQALSSSTAIYAFDPSGVGGLESFAASRPTRQVGDPERFRRFLREVSDNTGGRATLLTNDYGPGLTRMFEETASYYLLGYESPAVPDDGAFRRVEVKTSRPGTTVRARTGYFARRPPAAATRPNARAPVDLAIADVIPRGDLAMQAMAAPFAIPARNEAAVAIVVGFRHRVSADALQQRVELVTGAFDHEGRQVGVQHQTARLHLRRGDQGEANYELLTRIDLKSGRYSLRIGAHNTVIDKSGSVFVDVDVPDFSRERLSLSGLLLTATSSPMVAPRDALHPVVPVVPSTLRHFRAEDHVSGFLRVYQGGKESLQPVTIAVRLTDANGRIVTNSVEFIPGERFAPTRAFDYSVPIVVSSLVPGEYLIEVEAKQSTVEPRRRQIRFHIR
jgi:VWFA-related protein